MATTAEAGFRTFINRLVPTATEREKASSHRATIYARLDATFGLHRMFETGSFKHGTGVSQYSDLDYFASLKTPRPQLSASSLDAVRDKLVARFPNTRIHVSRPAVVLEFGQGYERVEVIPAYANENVTGEYMKFWIPGVVGEWLESTPEAHVSYVNGCNTVPSQGRAKAFVRMVKAWKYYRNVPVSSFYLEMRAATYIASREAVDYPYDLYRFLNNLAEQELAAMNDPTGATGRIVACGTSTKRTDALSKLSTATARASRALEFYRAGKASEAFEQWGLLFDGHFPAYG